MYSLKSITNLVSMATMDSIVRGFWRMPGRWLQRVRQWTVSLFPLKTGITLVPGWGRLRARARGWKDRAGGWAIEGQEEAWPEASPPTNWGKVPWECEKSGIGFDELSWPLVMSCLGIVLVSPWSDGQFNGYYGFPVLPVSSFFMNKMW